MTGTKVKRAPRAVVIRTTQKNDTSCSLEWLAAWNEYLKNDTGGHAA